MALAVLQADSNSTASSNSTTAEDGADAAKADKPDGADGSDDGEAKTDAEATAVPTSDSDASATATATATAAPDADADADAAKSAADVDSGNATAENATEASPSPPPKVMKKVVHRLPLKISYDFSELAVQPLSEKDRTKSLRLCVSCFVCRVSHWACVRGSAYSRGALVHLRVTPRVPSTT